MAPFFVDYKFYKQGKKGNLWKLFSRMYIGGVRHHSLPYTFTCMYYTLIYEEFAESFV